MDNGEVLATLAACCDRARVGWSRSHQQSALLEGQVRDVQRRFKENDTNNRMKAEDQDGVGSSVNTLIQNDDIPSESHPYSWPLREKQDIIEARSGSREGIGVSADAIPPMKKHSLSGLGKSKRSRSSRRE